MASTLRWIWLLALLTACLLGMTEGYQYRIAQNTDNYPWKPCNPFEATKKNCPLGEACLKLKSFSYAWNWAMRCQSREEYIAKAEYIYGLKK